MNNEKMAGRLRAAFESPTARACAALIAVMVLGAVFNADGAFFRWATHRDMFRQVSVYAILSCGMTLVIISGGIDLAVGSLLALTAVLFSLFTIQMGLSPWIAVPACLITGTLCGALSGGSIARFGVQPFIATLAMMVLARGLAKLVSGGRKISTAVQQADGTFRYADLPGIFDFLSSKVLMDSVAVVTIVLLACAIVSYLLLSRLRWGRYIYAIGGNEEAAGMSGVPVAAMKVLVYGASGLFCAVAGICQAAQEQQGDPETGAGYELTAIAMVVIGGTSLNGGRGSIWLTLIGVVTIGYLEKVLSINAIGEASRLMLTGAVILAAVLFQKGKR
jgi:ribose transport system permease protein